MAFIEPMHRNKPNITYLLTPHTKASDAELWCFLWSAPWINVWVNNRDAGDLILHRAHYDVIVMLLQILYSWIKRVLNSTHENEISWTHWPHLVCFECITCSYGKNVYLRDFQWLYSKKRSVLITVWMSIRCNFHLAPPAGRLIVEICLPGPAFTTGRMVARGRIRPLPWCDPPRTVSLRRERQ